MKMEIKISYLNSFAAGIILAASIIGAVYFADKDNSEVTIQTQSESQQERISHLEKDGYIILTKAEFEKEILDAKQEAFQEQNEETDETSPEEEIVKTVVIEVTSGMTSYHVGQALKAEGLIDIEPFPFSKEIERRGLDKKLQLGTYTIDSNMDLEQIIAIIFN